MIFGFGRYLVQVFLNPEIDSELGETPRAKARGGFRYDM